MIYITITFRIKRLKTKKNGRFKIKDLDNKTLVIFNNKLVIPVTKGMNTAMSAAYSIHSYNEDYRKGSVKSINIREL